MEFKFNHYYRNRSGEIVLLAGIIPDRLCRNEKYMVVFSDGSHTWIYPEGNYLSNKHKESTYDLVEHLPDCTGFDWVPPKPEPKYIPWTFDTMPDSVKVKWKGLGKYMAYPLSESACKVGTANYSYKSLLENCTRLDGTPCGELVDG